MYCPYCSHRTVARCVAIAPKMGVTISKRSFSLNFNIVEDYHDMNDAGKLRKQLTHTANVVTIAEQA